MAKTNEESESVGRELAEIKSLLQTLIIIEGARAGLKREQVRELTGVRTQRVSAIWGDIKNRSEQ